MGNAKLNIGDANGFGLEWIFRGQCRWGKYNDMDALIIQGPSTNFKKKAVIFAGAAASDSFKKVRGNSYGMWIATEINLHHDSFIKEAFNRQLAAKRRKIFWDMNPDHPKSPIYVEYIDKYAELNKEGKLLGGYNYQHFTLRDNVNIPPERIQEIISQYEPGSVWYIRDIEGKRSIAEGLIYHRIAASYAKKDKKYFMSIQDTIDACNKGYLSDITVGVDFGGNHSGHAFCCTGNLNQHRALVALASEWNDAQNTDPEDLNEMFLNFCRKIISRYGRIDRCYCDSAEQVLIRGLENALIKNRMGQIVPRNALKHSINDRIFTTTALIAQGRWYHTEDCESLLSAMSMAVWDEDEIDPVRKDDGTSDIDSLDAYEYTYEGEMGRYIDLRGGR